MSFLIILSDFSSNRVDEAQKNHINSGKSIKIMKLILEAIIIYMQTFSPSIKWLIFPFELLKDF